MVHRKKTGYWRKQGGRSGLEICLANKISALVTGQRCSAGLWRRSLLMISAGRDGARRLVTSCLAKIMPCNMHLITSCVTFSTRAIWFRMLQPCRSRAGPDETTVHTTSKSFSQRRPVQSSLPSRTDGLTDSPMPSNPPDQTISTHWELFTLGLLVLPYWNYICSNNASALHALLP